MLTTAPVSQPRDWAKSAQTDRREEGEKDAGENRTEDIERETRRIEKKAKEHMKDVCVCVSSTRPSAIRSLCQPTA